MSSSVGEAHKIAELDACERLLEAGLIGARIYSGPSVVGSFYSRQDKLLSEIKWMAVDVFEQRKLAVAQCQLVSGMVRKYWSERSRGSLSSAASMVQGYWLSVAREIRAPVPECLRKGAIFKLNTLQSIRQGGAVSAPSSLLPTPTAGALGQGDLVEHGKTLAHGMVHDWLSELASQSPPTAEGTTGLADFCVQILKHNFREEQGHHAVHESGSTAPASVPTVEPLSPIEENEAEECDFLIPIDSCLKNGYRAATLTALEQAVQQSASMRGVQGLLGSQATIAGACADENIIFSNRALPIEVQRTVLQEIAATNIMSRSPQLFGLAANLAASQDSAASKQRPGLETSQRRSRAVEEVPNGGAVAAVQHKHYFVSVIFSTFSPAQWEPCEDVFLKKSVSSSGGMKNIDWAFVASSVNWRMRASLGYDLLRTAQQCAERFGKEDFVKQPVNVPLPILRRRRYSSCFVSKPIAATSSISSSSHKEEEFFSEQDAFHFSPAKPANAFERRAVYAVTKPPSSHFARLFFHHVSEPVLLIARGASSSKKIPLVPIWEPLSVAACSRSVVSPPPKVGASTLDDPDVLQARQDQLKCMHALVSRLIETRSHSESPPKRAFSVEDMIRKNSSAVPGYVPQYISGQLVCPVHPSFANMTRIAEMTLNRLIGSVSDTSGGSTAPVLAVPVPIDALFNYCTMFRKKYPAVFTSQHKVTKPSMPQLRASVTPGGPPTKMLTRQQAVAHRQPVQASPVPSQSVSSTPAPEPAVEATAPPASSSANNWLRTTSNRQKRSSVPPSRSSNSPSTESAPPPANPAAFMVAGGPSLYGQFGRSRAPGR